MHKPSTRAQVITRRTYNRPKENGTFETWEETINRVIQHQQWLWERQLKRVLVGKELFELQQLKKLYLQRIALCSGRTLWLGGTETCKRREASQFNCSFCVIRTVYDVVDLYWLLLQGCGTGFKADVGILNGFSSYVSEIEIIDRKPNEPYVKNIMSDYNQEYLNNDCWTLIIGDSAEAWAKAVGKILVMKHKVNKIVLDFRKIRNAGERLAGYGWISSGSLTLQKALKSICNILNKKIDMLLDEIDILDIMNHLGLTLSSRRSAEICLMDFENSKWEEFALIKDKHWIDNPQRSQSNNSLVFNKKPSRAELVKVFQLMEQGGGSEPGFINGESARKRKPYFKGVNPCGEQLLSDKSFCCLSEIDLSKLNDKTDAEVEKIFRLVGRANYRQTCVNLNDGVLHKSWDEVNSFLHLVGLGITGIVSWKHCKSEEKFRQLKQWASDGIDSMADELNLPRSKGKLNIKPSGTLSKIMGTSESETPEGCHFPIGKFIFNNIRFSRYDCIVEKLRKANYFIFDDPYASDSVLIRIPVCYKNIQFGVVNGIEVNVETALEQLQRYKLLMETFVDNNCSITVSYSPEEVPLIIDWLLENWDSYVGVSFMYRNDPSKSAKDLNYPYLPQECVTEEVFNSYVSKLKDFDLDNDDDAEKSFNIDTGISCAGGMCPEK